MADQNAKSSFIGLKFGIQRFLGSLITDRSSTFRNSKWWMQYDGPKYKKFIDKSYLIGIKFASQEFSWSSNLKCFLLRYEFAGNCCCHYVILDTLFGIVIFWLRIRNEQSQKSSSTEFCPNQVTSLHFALPYSIHYSQFLKVELGFVISDPKNPQVPNFIPIK